MVLMENRQVVLTSRPSGIPQAENFAIRQGAMPAPASGEILVRNHYLSIEPAMRGWISDAGNYSDPVPIGGVMRSLAAAQRSEERSVGKECVSTGRARGQPYSEIKTQTHQKKAGD